MSEQITWTHVDKMVRKMLDDRGMLQTGMNDAEVTYNLIKYMQRHERVLELAKEQVENTLANERRMGDVLKKEILDLKSSKGRTKKRLDKLEQQVEKLNDLARMAGIDV